MVSKLVLAPEGIREKMTVTETRAKAMEENVKKLESQLHNFMADSSKTYESTNAKLDDLAKKFDVLLEKMLPTQTGVLGGAPMGQPAADGSTSRSRGEHLTPPMAMDRTQHNHYTAKIDFPYFDGAKMQKVFRLQSHNKCKAKIRRSGLTP